MASVCVQVDTPPNVCAAEMWGRAEETAWPQSAAPGPDASAPAKSQQLMMSLQTDLKAFANSNGQKHLAVYMVVTTRTYFAYVTF